MARIWLIISPLPLLSANRRAQTNDIAVGAGIPLFAIVPALAQERDDLAQLAGWTLGVWLIVGFVFSVTRRRGPA